MALGISLLIFAIASIILSSKNRGCGYYLLAFLLPIVGLIVAICLKKKEEEEKSDISSESFDITKND